LGADLARLPRHFCGTILLHPYLVDLALTLGLLDQLDSLLGLIRRQHPQARLGIHTNLVTAAANAFPALHNIPDDLSGLVSPNVNPMATASVWSKATPRGGGCRMTAEVGPGPLAVHRIARHSPAKWATDAHFVLIHGAADESLSRAARSDLRAGWTKVFPGLEDLDILW